MGIISQLFNHGNPGKDYIEQKYQVDVPDLPKDKGLYLFCIYDTVCEEYNPPFVSKNMKTAIRSLTESLKNGQSLIKMHPEDYVLIKIACFDNTTGVVSSCLQERQPLIDIIIQDTKE